jgi:hypothetical protein
MISLFNIYRKLRRGKVRRQFLKRLENNIAEVILILVLNLMNWWFKTDKEFRRNIDGFTGRYQFRNADESFTVAALFTGKGLKVKKGLIKDEDVSVIFKNDKSLETLMKFLLTRDPDILKLILNNEVKVEGNMNYMFRFLYIAKQLKAKLPVPLAGG